MTLTLLRHTKSPEITKVKDILFYLGKIAERLCLIEAAAGTCGNISVKADSLPLEMFPGEGSRRRVHHKLDRGFPDLLERRFLITGSGKNLRYISERPHECLGLIEITQDGYDILWGLEEADVITSESAAHFYTYSRRPQVSAFIHAQPRSINVASRLFRREDRFNRILNVQHEQIKTCCPNGIGLVDTVKHGSYELAESVTASLAKKDICAVVRHGTFSVGEGDPIKALNRACDLQEYYHDACRTFLDNPWLRLVPVEFMLENVERVSRLPFGDKLVSAFLRPPK